MTLSIKNDGHEFKKKNGFNIFYVIMNRVPIIANFKRPIYQTFN